MPQIVEWALPTFLYAEKITSSIKLGMGILAIQADERVKSVSFTEDAISVDLMDGRIITVPLVWYPKLLNALPEQRMQWEICGGGYGIHWDEIDEDLSTAGMLRGAPAPNAISASVS